MTIKLIRNGIVLDSKVVVILGDTDGDGEISINDAVIVVNHVGEISYMLGAYEKAGDTDKDGEISINDAVKVVNHVGEIEFLW